MTNSHLSDNIEVTHTNIGCDCGPSFTTNTSCCTLERARTGTEDARAGARRNVVTQGIMSNPTAALRACEWEWQPQATENKHPEEGGVERQLRGCGARCEYPGSKWAGL